VRILFSGCSIVAGTGLEYESDCFANIIANNLNAKLTNIAVGGNSNERIFLDTAQAMITNHYDTIVVGWTSFPRHVFWPGLELYETKRNFCPGIQNYSKILGTKPSPNSIPEHKGNDLSFSSEEFDKLQSWFMLLTHDHYYIVDIMRYINILVDLAKLHKSRVVFVNTLLPWDMDYFKQFEIDKNITIKSDTLTNYTNWLLNSNNRDDKEIDLLFRKIAKDYNDNQGIQSTHWLNLYNSLHSMTVDKGTDNVHPGKQSHDHFAKFLIEQLN